MGKQNRGRKKKKQSQAPKQPRMTTEKIAQAKTWLERMRINVFRAIALSERMSPDDMDESNDLFWALVKYTENVQESAKQLDDINSRIYPSLIEFDNDTWQDLKRMRDYLAHKFWDIDPHILWSTVTSDFLDLSALLSTIIVIDQPMGDNEKFSFDFKTERLLGLPDVAPGSVVEAGQSIIAVVFGHNGKVGVFRVGHDGTNKLVMSSNFDTRFTLYGRR